MREFSSIVCVLLLCIAAVQCIQPDEKILKICLDKVELSEEEYKVISTSHKLPDEPLMQKFKCFTHCYLENSGAFNDKGKVDMQVWSSTEPMNAKQSEMLQNCISQHDAENDPCEYGYKMSVCFLKGIIILSSP